MHNYETPFSSLRVGDRFTNFKKFDGLFQNYKKTYDLTYFCRSTKYVANDSKAINKNYNPDIVFSEYHLMCKGTDKK